MYVEHKENCQNMESRLDPGPVATHLGWVNRRGRVPFYLHARITHINSMLKASLIPICIWRPSQAKCVRWRWIHQTRTTFTDMDSYVWLKTATIMVCLTKLFHIDTLQTMTVWAWLYLIHHQPSVPIYGAHLPSFDLSAGSLKKVRATSPPLDVKLSGP